MDNSEVSNYRLYNDVELCINGLHDVERTDYNTYGNDLVYTSMRIDSILTVLHEMQSYCKVYDNKFNVIKVGDFVSFTDTRGINKRASVVGFGEKEYGEQPIDVVLLSTGDYAFAHKCVVDKTDSFEKIKNDSGLVPNMYFNKVNPKQNLINYSTMIEDIVE